MAGERRAELEMNEKGHGEAKTKHWDSVMDEEGS